MRFSCGSQDPRGKSSDFRACNGRSWLVCHRCADFEPPTRTSELIRSIRTVTLDRTDAFWY